MFSQRGMIVIPDFSIRILSTPPRTFICDPIRPRSLLARLTECRWESWILRAHLESRVREIDIGCYQRK
jgi:hypothetical protein